MLVESGCVNFRLIFRNCTMHSGVTLFESSYNILLVHKSAQITAAVYGDKGRREDENMTMDNLSILFSAGFKCCFQGERLRYAIVTGHLEN